MKNELNLEILKGSLLHVLEKFFLQAQNLFLYLSKNFKVSFQTYITWCIIEKKHNQIIFYQGV